ncbi:MAG: helix-turn-helix domain-containing protein [Candidatus Omnitrophica bacterium]|nr:helix-turn-helix domain-containing protein [Candidatus Omnitrophota bacterium]
MRPIFARVIYPQEERKLRQLIKHGGAQISKRAKAIILSSIHRYSVAEISRMVNFHPNHLRKWIHRFNQSGIVSIINSPESGVQKKFDKKIKEKIISIVRKSPRKCGLLFSYWTLYKLKHYLEEQKIVDKISHETIRRILKEYQINLRRKQFN